MIKRILLLLLISSFASEINAQKSAGDYSYVVVPELYEFLHTEDQHQLNSLTKFLFNKHGFNAYFPSELPNVKRCDGLQAEVIGKPGFIYTKITIILKDCYGEEVFRSEEGKSKYKEYKKAYHDALRKAFVSIEELGVHQKETKVYEDDFDNDADSPAPTEINKMKDPPVGMNDDKSNVTAGSGSKITTVVVALNLPEAKFSNYQLDGNSYLLRKTDTGYSLYRETEDSETGLALEGVILVDGLKLSYVSEAGDMDVKFDENGDLTLWNSVMKFTYIHID